MKTFCSECVYFIDNKRKNGSQNNCSYYNDKCSNVNNDGNCKRFKKQDNFEIFAKPLMKWLAENKHPHCSIILTSTTAELVEGIQCINTDEFLID